MNNYQSSEKDKLLRTLLALRKKAGLRQVDLAVRLGRPQSFVSKYESGEKTLTFLEVKEICEALGITLSEFVQRLEAYSK